MTIVANQDSRNANWSKGSIGSKLLSKMGWTEGTGLGKRRSGTAVPLRALRQSAEAAGIGSKASDADGSQGWNRTTDGYASVLQSLQAQHGTGATSNAAGEVIAAAADGSSKKSKKKKKKLVLAKNRVTAGHSRKLREAKDLSTKSQADMAAIFGGVPQAIAAQTSAGGFKKKKKRKRETPTPPIEVEVTEEEAVVEEEVEEVVVSKEDQKKEKKSKKKKGKKSDNNDEKPKKKRKKDKK
jgi:hypothetical protein